MSAFPSQRSLRRDENFDLIALNFAQFLSPYFGLTIGKYATITDSSGDMNEFAHGKGDINFMNLAFNANPIIVFTVPYSTLGTGLIVLPTKDPKEAIVTLTLLQANGQPNTKRAPGTFITTLTSICTNQKKAPTEALVSLDGWVFPMAILTS